MSGTDDAYRRALRDRRDRQFQRLAEAAEAMAATAETSARIHDQMTNEQPDAAEHAARERLLAAAERDAAEAFRAGELPSSASREAIRASGTRVDARGADDRGVDQHDTEGQ
jgi:hypothetical protein